MGPAMGTTRWRSSQRIPTGRYGGNSSDAGAAGRVRALGRHRGYGTKNQRHLHGSGKKWFEMRPGQPSERITPTTFQAIMERDDAMAALQAHIQAGGQPHCSEDHFTVTYKQALKTQSHSSWQWNGRKKGKKQQNWCSRTGKIGMTCLQTNSEWQHNATIIVQYGSSSGKQQVKPNLKFGIMRFHSSTALTKKNGKTPTGSLSSQTSTTG